MTTEDYVYQFLVMTAPFIGVGAIWTMIQSMRDSEND